MNLASALQIVSLHAMGGPLKECCAVSYGNMLYVYPLTALPGRAWAPKASWQAHRGAVTALHRSSFGVQLLSGATDGSIHLCVHPSYMCSHCALTHIIAAVLSSRGDHAWQHRRPPTQTPLRDPCHGDGTMMQ